MWRGNKRILFQVFSIQKITDMLSSNHNLSLYTKPGGGVMPLHDYGYLPPGFLKSYPVSE